MLVYEVVANPEVNGLSGWYFDRYKLFSLDPMGISPSERNMVIAIARGITPEEAHFYDMQITEAYHRLA